MKVRQVKAREFKKEVHKQAKHGMLTTDTMAVEGNNEVKERINKEIRK
jgi:hypothetical protein